MPVNYRSLVEGGFYSSNPFDRRVSVSVRCNNPGAIVPRVKAVADYLVEVFQRERRLLAG
jgi:hypothetical protein